MRVGYATSLISPSGGGIYQVVRSLAEVISSKGVDVFVYGADKDNSGGGTKPWGNAHVYPLKAVGPSTFNYMPDLSAHLEASNLDVLHSHGLWAYPSIGCYRWGAKRSLPRVVTPHGMLDSWAVQNSAWKKRVASAFYERANLASANCIHALCESELHSIRSFGLKNPVCVIPNGIDVPQATQIYGKPDWAKDLPDGTKTLLFLSRIHPKKGLVNLLKAWREASKGRPAIGDDWILVIAGWDDGSHLDELRKLSVSLGIELSVRFIGPQFGEQKDMTFRAADAFILPSFSEGLPLVVLEAWSYGLPVIMTRHCNLPEGFSAGAALRIEANVKSISDVLQALFKMPSETRAKMGSSGKALIEKQFRWSKIADEMVAVYNWLLGSGDAPDCVESD